MKKILYKCSFELYPVRRMKTVAATVGSTATASEEILGKVSTIQTRWSLGTLVSEALSKITEAVTVIVTKTGVKIYHSTDFATNIAQITTLEGCLLHIGRAAGTSKSRPLIPLGASDVVDAPSIQVGGYRIDIDSIAPIDVLSLGLLQPTQPSLSAIGVMNKVEAFLDTVEDNSFVVMDQTSEKVLVLDSTKYGTFTSGITPIISFDFVVDAPVVDPTAMGWE